MAGSDPTVTFYFGLGSRYSYLAATQIPQLIANTGAYVTWRPILSSHLTASHDHAPFRWDDAAGEWWGARVSGQYKDAYRRVDLARWAALYDVPYQEPKPPAMDATRRTLYCVAAVLDGREVGSQYAARMFDLIYAEGVAIDESTCHSLAADVDLNPQSLAALVDSGEAEQVHARWLGEAKKAGVFGVPSFVHQESVFWGNDRLVLLEAALSAS